ncbi:NAD-dependent deacetylase sirtuin-6-like, putative [Babesia ovis]|uniref:protein acetyllysine N-acetyltransferase n=1 Tax=Babesia ovis TaxID=5869 RepID=A0A9W5TDX5_BABOV|nr:NAD-dependent deacetylase sirtuin-6-like, putative [Babesia ovis]
MASSALNYASQLRRNDNKGPCGGVQLFDTPAEISRKFKKLFALITEAKYAAVHTGAGISTAAGIPDFRGPSGVWTLMSQQNRSDGKRRKMTDGDCTVKSTTESCVEYGNKKLEPVEFSHALPSEAHLATLALLRAGHIHTVITQNIDGLHAISGMRHNECTELHGNVFIERCISCGRRYLRPYVAPTISFKPTGNHCGLCCFPPCGILTDVVLDWFDRYEDHFEKRAISHAENADFHLTLGSSLHVEPACLYASNEHYRREESPLVIVNYQKTRLDAEADVVLHCDVNKICKKLVKALEITVPPFIRRYCMVGLRYIHGNHNKVLLRFPCIANVMVPQDYTTSSGVSHRCLNITQGLHEFMYHHDFEVTLRLWFKAEMVLYIRYDPNPGLAGFVWKISLAATNGSYNKQNTTPVTHDFEETTQAISVSKLTLSYNASLITKSDACCLIAVLDTSTPNIDNFQFRSIPGSISILSSYFRGINSCSTAVFQSLVDLKDEVDPEDLNSIDNIDVLPDIMKTCIRIALDRRLGNISRNQFCIDIDALKGVQTMDRKLHSGPSNIRLFCAVDYEFGDLVDRVPTEMRLCLPRRIKPITASRPMTTNPMETLFQVILQHSVTSVLQHKVETPAVIRLVKQFKSDFPRWMVTYLADLFECR